MVNPMNWYVSESDFDLFHSTICLLNFCLRLNGFLYFEFFHRTKLNRKTLKYKREPFFEHFTIFPPMCFVRIQYCKRFSSDKMTFVNNG